MTLQEARAKSGLSVRKAARLIGVFPSTVVGWELHGRMPPHETLLKAAEVYGVNALTLRRGPSASRQAV